MVDLTASYLGLKLRTALVPSASPLSQNIDRVCRLEDAGASAAVCTRSSKSNCEKRAVNHGAPPAAEVLSQSMLVANGHSIWRL
jgi:hypothetical protein